MYISTIDCRFTQMIAYFLVMNSKKCTLGLHVDVFLEAFMVWLSKIVSTDNSTTNRFYILAGKQVQKQFPFLQGKGGNQSMW